jgi:carboxymethylenebutenolidase
MASEAPEKHRVTLTSGDGHSLTAWRSDPAGPAKGGIVILHAVWGLTDHIGDVCSQWANAGYAAIAPALFDRVGSGLLHAYGRPGATAGSANYASLSEQDVFADVQTAADALGQTGKTAISGFCTGGTWAWRAAAHLAFAAQVNFYGSHVGQFIDLTPRCPTIMHYGDSDTIADIATVNRIAAAHPDVSAHIYPGAGHAFFNLEQETFDGEAAALAWSRSVTFMDRHVAGL